MSTSVGIFNVARVEVTAYSLSLCMSLSNGQNRAHYQKLTFFDGENHSLGEVTLYLDQPLAALAIGDCSELDGFQEPVSAPSALPVPTLRLISQVSGF